MDRGGKGSHRNFVHPKVVKTVTLSGNLGDDGPLRQDRGMVRMSRQPFPTLCEIVETLELFKKEVKPLPPPAAGKDYANKMLTVVATSLSSMGQGVP